MAFRIVYSPECQNHLRSLSARERVVVLDAVDAQLTQQPTVVTRNRKRLKPNRLAPWELRIGDLRVFYDVTEGPDAVVRVRAVGVKERNVLRIGGEEIAL